jgi:hypothetical protein
LCFDIAVTVNVIEEVLAKKSENSGTIRYKG